MSDNIEELLAGLRATIAQKNQIIQEDSDVVKLTNPVKVGIVENDEQEIYSFLKKIIYSAVHEQVNRNSSVISEAFLNVMEEDQFQILLREAIFKYISQNSKHFDSLFKEIVEQKIAKLMR